MPEDACDGLKKWLTQTLDQYERPLVAYAARIVGNTDRARDVVQETFLKLIRQDRHELDGKLPQWLYTVCRNQAIDMKRKEDRMHRSAGATRLAGEVSRIEVDRAPADPLAIVEREERATHTRQLVEALPEKQQEAICLRFEQGLSYKQIADVMATNVNNVGVLIHAGMKTLRQKLCVNSERGRT